MVKLCNKNECCGCEACFNACKAGAISMKEDDEGFRFPIIDSEVCLNCGLCEKKCPVLNLSTINKENKRVCYAAYSKNYEVRTESSSGGVFTCLAQVILEKGGAVFGTRLDEDCLGASIVEVTDISELEKLRGSKYMQSKVDDAYIRVKELLNDNRLVLFSGTPCQVEALYGFLGRKYENLFTIDFICYAVPSPKVWRKYVAYKENCRKDRVKKAYFRNKEKGWEDFGIKLCYENGSNEFNVFSQDYFGKVFKADLCFRKSCEQCQFRKEKRISDITIGDFWGIQTLCKEIDAYEGVSVLITNNEKAEKWLYEIEDTVFLKKVAFEDVLKRNPYFINSFRANKNRNAFFSGLDSIAYDGLVEKYAKERIGLRNKIVGFFERFKIWHRIKPILRKIF